MKLIKQMLYGMDKSAKTIIKDERLKYIRIMRKLNITVLLTYVLMYVTFLGAYGAEKYTQEMESSIFVWERTSVAAVVGELFSLSVITC